MSIEISRETEAYLSDEARRQGVSVDILLKRLIIGERGAPASAVGTGTIPELPLLHLGAMDAMHRRDIYDDVG